MKPILLAVTATVSLTVVAPAWAQDVTPDDPDETRVTSRYGMSVFVGGGVGTFVDEDMRDLTGLAGVWEARLNLGSLLPVGVELAYVGAAQSIDATGLEDDVMLLTTILEGNLRFNVLPTERVQPYVFGGLGWARYDLVNVDSNDSDVAEVDNTLVVPAGVGFAFRIEPFLLDLRGTYRFNFDEDLVSLANRDDDKQNLDAWSAALRAGFEF